MSLLHEAAASALRRIEPELAHRLSVRGLSAGLGPRDGSADNPALAVELAGLHLPNCIGLAAGFDKDAQAVDGLVRLGFGFVECGSVTPLAQPGNPRPRMFRLRDDRAVINRLGFNNAGLEAFAARLVRRRRRGLVGANLGANKDSADRIADYVAGLRRLWGLCDYFTVNISSPNTPGLRSLQSRTSLDELAGRLGEARTQSSAGPHCPIFLKIAPDLTDAEIVDIIASAAGHGLDGIIVSNTTITRPDTLTSSAKAEAGGLSGAPLFELSTQMLRRFRASGSGDLPLIGVGGVSSGAHAYAKIRAGASAVQLYTALAYEGPGLVPRIKREMTALLRSDGFSKVSEAIGVESSL